MIRSVAAFVQLQHRKRYRLAIFCTVSLAISVGCSYWEEDDISWGIVAVAPQHYEMWIINAHLEAPGVRSWRAPIGGGVRCCWMGPDGPFGSGGPIDPFPSLIALHWFSFSEQKFYSTLFEVPSDLQDRMRVPAPTATQSKDVLMKPRRTLVLGLAPGGEVVVWMMSQRSNAVEVMRVPAVEVEGDLEAFEIRTREYLEQHGAYIEEHGVPLEGW